MDAPPILFSICFRNNVEMGMTKPMHLFVFTSKTNLSFGDGWNVDETWKKKSRILFDILKKKYLSEQHFEPLKLYAYNDEDISFTLKSNKPKSDFELVSYFDFSDNLRQDGVIVQKFLELQMTPEELILK